MFSMKFGGDALVFGEGSLEYISTLSCKAALIVSAPSARRRGQMKAVTDQLDKIGARYTTYEDIEPDPGFETVQKAARLALEFQPDLIIGLGGGSAIDAAKAIWAVYENPELDSLEKLKQPGAIKTLRQKAKMLIVPTTSGTGSEVTRSAVITDNANSVKVPVAAMQMVPDIAVLSPELTATMPAGLTANTALDALTHAVEAYVSIRANDFSDAMAEKAAQIILEYLPLTLAEPENLSYREKMQNASTMAGMSFAFVGLGVTHSIAHTFGGMYHIPHGQANAIALPYVMAYNCQNETVAAKYRHLSALCGVEDLVETIVALKQQLKVPACMQEVVPDAAKYEELSPALVKSVLADMCVRTNPVSVNAEQAKALMDKVYYGK